MGRGRRCAATFDFHTARYDVRSRGWIALLGRRAIAVADIHRGRRGRRIRDELVGRRGSCVCVDVRRSEAKRSHNDRDRRALLVARLARLLGLINLRKSLVGRHILGRLRFLQTLARGHQAQRDCLAILRTNPIYVASWELRRRGDFRLVVWF